MSWWFVICFEGICLWREDCAFGGWLWVINRNPLKASLPTSFISSSCDVVVVVAVVVVLVVVATVEVVVVVGGFMGGFASGFAICSFISL